METTSTKHDYTLLIDAIQDLRNTYDQYSINKKSKKKKNVKKLDNLIETLKEMRKNEER